MKRKETIACQKRYVWSSGKHVVMGDLATYKKEYEISERSEKVSWKIRNLF